ncbi:hypothetical protein [Agarilytica rhodophyticola]|nr:hypothetical protein [Agarilytica rhodophyticola]
MKIRNDDSLSWLSFYKNAATDKKPSSFAKVSRAMPAFLKRNG